jgi:hypothetical protein
MEPLPQGLHGWQETIQGGSYNFRNPRHGIALQWFLFYFLITIF